MQNVEKYTSNTQTIKDSDDKADAGGLHVKIGCNWINYGRRSRKELKFSGWSTIPNAELLDDQQFLVKLWQKSVLLYNIKGKRMYKLINKRVHILVGRTGLRTGLILSNCTVWSTSSLPVARNICSTGSVSFPAAKVLCTNPITTDSHQSNFHMY